MKISQFLTLSLAISISMDLVKTKIFASNQPLITIVQSPIPTHSKNIIKPLNGPFTLVSDWGGPNLTRIAIAFGQPVTLPTNTADFWIETSDDTMSNIIWNVPTTNTIYKLQAYVETIPAHKVPAQHIPAHTVPANKNRHDKVPAQHIQAHTIPAHTIPASKKTVLLLK